MLYKKGAIPETYRSRLTRNDGVSPVLRNILARKNIIAIEKTGAQRKYEINFFNINKL